MKILFKTISILLIQTLLAVNCACAGNAEFLIISTSSQGSTLSPQIHISSPVFHEKYNFLYEHSWSDSRKDINPESAAQPLFSTINDGENKRIDIKTVEGKPISIIIPSWQKDPIYKGWIIKQYGFKGLANHPNLVLKLVMKEMLKNADIFKNSVVLEAGVGDAVLAVMADKLGARKIYGVDSDREILKIAEKIISMNQTENIHLINGDFIKNDLNLKEKPAVLLLNNGYDMEAAKQIMLNKYPSLKYVIMAKNGRVFVENLGKASQSNPEHITDEDILFKYADEFGPDLRLPTHTEKGRLLAIVVTPDGEFAYALRKEILKNGTMQINILELNPFGKDIGNIEKKEGHYGNTIEVDVYPKYSEGVTLFCKAIFEEETAKHKTQELTLQGIAKKTDFNFIDLRSNKQQTKILRRSKDIPKEARGLNMSSKELKEAFYRISGADFDCERNAGFWPVKKPTENIFSICTVVVFVDEDNNTFMAHFVVNKPNPEEEINTWFEKWKKYGYSDGQKEIQWFNQGKLFKKSTRALIINAHENSTFSKRIKDFLLKEGLSDAGVHIVPVPPQKSINSVGLFIWPKDMLEIYYNESEGFNEKTSFEIKQYNLKKGFTNHKILRNKLFADNPAQKIDSTQIKKKLLDNKLINKFFAWYAIKSLRSMPWEIILDEVFSDNEFIKESIKEIESKGEQWIAEEGWKLHNEHPSRSSYRKSKKKNSWAEFVAESSQDEFTLAHLLNATIGLVKGYRELGLEEKAIEFFKQGYIILRAIEIASREDIEKAEAVPDTARYETTFGYVGLDQIKKAEAKITQVLRARLSPIKNIIQLTLANEVRIEIKNHKDYKAAVSGNDMLLKNIISGEELLIGLIPRMAPTSGRQKPSVKRKKSFIDIGNKSYRIIDRGIIDEKTGALYDVKRKDGILVIDLNKIDNNPELDEFLDKKSSTNNSHLMTLPLLADFAALIEESI